MIVDGGRGVSLDLVGKRFVASYSGGKDSLLAVYRAVNAGLKPLGLITTHNADENRSWFHGMNTDVLYRVSESLGIPLTLVNTTGAKYEEDFEKALSEAKRTGAEVCVFGDIDIEGHLRWCSERCLNTGLIPYFPLLREDRKKVIFEFLDAGFSAVIKTVDTSRMPGRFIGKLLSREVALEIEKCGADVCGENGEYHSFVFDGPMFSQRVLYTAASVAMGRYVHLNIALKENQATQM